MQSDSGTFAPFDLTTAPLPAVASGSAHEKINRHPLFSLGRPLLALLLFSGQLQIAGAQAAFSDADWLPLGSGLDNTVLALAGSGGTVYAGGQISMAGNVSVNGIAQWDGSNWTPLGSG